MKHIALVLLLFVIMVFFSAQNTKAQQTEFQNYQEKLMHIQQMAIKPSVKEQMKEGIFAEDVMCNGNKVLVLKWTEDSSACVTKYMAKHLVERGWGITREQAVVGSRWGCAEYTQIYYNNVEHDHSKIIQTIRNTVKQFMHDDNVWTPISIVHHENNDFIGSGRVISDSKLSDEISDALKMIRHVSNVTSDIMCVD